MRRVTDYGMMVRQLAGLSEGVDWDITILSNAAGLLWDSLEDINTNIIELDSLYSAVVEMHEKTKDPIKREILLSLLKMLKN